MTLFVTLYRAPSTKKENKSMAAIPVTIDGMLYDLYARTSQRVILFGDASVTGIGIGGGPIIPPGQPPGIWGGGNVPMPSPPIANVPGAPGYQPPERPPEPVQPPVEWKAVWHPTEGWIVVGIPQVPVPTPS